MAASAVDDGTSINVVVFYLDDYRRNPHDVPSALSYVQAWPLNKLHPAIPEQTFEDIQENMVCQVDIDGATHNCLVLSMEPASVRTLAELRDVVIRDKRVLEARGIMHLTRLKRRSANQPTTSAPKQPDAPSSSTASNQLPPVEPRSSTPQNSMDGPASNKVPDPIHVTPPSAPIQTPPVTPHAWTPHNIPLRFRKQASPTIVEIRPSDSTAKHPAEPVVAPATSSPSPSASSPSLPMSSPSPPVVKKPITLQGVPLKSSARKPAATSQCDRTYIVPAKIVCPPSTSERPSSPRVAHNCPKPKTTKGATGKSKPFHPTTPVMQSMPSARAKRAASVMQRDDFSDSEPDRSSDEEEPVVATSATTERTSPRVVRNCQRPKTPKRVFAKSTLFQPATSNMQSMPHASRAKRAASVMERDNDSSDSEPEHDVDKEEAAEPPVVCSRTSYNRTRSKSVGPAEITPRPACPKSILRKTPAAPPAASRKSRAGGASVEFPPGGAPVKFPPGGASTSAAESSVRKLEDINLTALSRNLLTFSKNLKQAARLVLEALFSEHELVNGVCTKRALNTIRNLQVESDAILLDQEKLAVARELVVEWMDAKTGSTTSENLFKAEDLYKVCRDIKQKERTARNLPSARGSAYKKNRT